MHKRKWVTGITKWIKRITYKWIGKRDRGDPKKIPGHPPKDINSRGSVGRQGGSGE